MLISLLLDVIYKIISTVLSVINLPDIPDAAVSYLNSFKELLVEGVHLLGAYIDLSYIKTLLIIFVTIVLAEELYHLVMWIIKKIPMLGIE